MTGIDPLWQCGQPDCTAAVFAGGPCCREHTAVELLRRVVMDYAPDDCNEDCACSAAAARRYLAQPTGGDPLDDFRRLAADLEKPDPWMHADDYGEGYVDGKNLAARRIRAVLAGEGPK